MQSAKIKTVIRYATFPPYNVFTEASIRNEEERVKNNAANLPPDANCRIYPGLEASLRVSASTHYPGGSFGNPALLPLFPWSTYGIGNSANASHTFWDTEAEVRAHERVHWYRFKDAFDLSFESFVKSVEEVKIPIIDNDSLDLAKQRFKAQELDRLLTELRDKVRQEDEKFNLGNNAHLEPDAFYNASLAALVREFQMLRQASSAKSCPSY